jgi:hypothetical protein
MTDHALLQMGGPKKKLQNFCGKEVFDAIFCVIIEGRNDF